MLLPVAEDIPAGRTDPLTLKPGTAHRIMTGAPLPAGATAVVPVEATDGATDTVVHPRERQAPASTSAAPARTSRRAPRCCARARCVTPAALGLAAALGLGELNVVPRQRVLVMSTGSELVAAGHAAAARPDLRVQRGDAGRGRARRRRRRGRRADDR